MKTENSDQEPVSPELATRLRLIELLARIEYVLSEVRSLARQIYWEEYDAESSYPVDPNDGA